MRNLTIMIMIICLLGCKKDNTQLSVPTSDECNLSSLEKQVFGKWYLDSVQFWQTGAQAITQTPSNNSAMAGNYMDNQLGVECQKNQETMSSGSKYDGSWGIDYRNGIALFMGNSYSGYIREVNSKSLVLRTDTSAYTNQIDGRVIFYHR